MSVACSLFLNAIGVFPCVISLLIFMGGNPMVTVAVDDVVEIGC